MPYWDSRREIFCLQKSLAFADVTIFVLGGIFTEEFSGAAALVISSTGLLGGAARYGAVLAGRSEREIERATAVGFFLGFGIGIFALVVDSAT